ncbi:MAG TPA: nitroreductase family deazaflavin-dependent oxidoreductase [Solirubrobacteraceae bacterium]|nr:nitroreductase family deazaflavin-dependent oxidoreductase [Solirubrobacteraceae bacterium]
MTETTSDFSDRSASTQPDAASEAPYRERPRNLFVRSAGGGRLLSALMLPDFMLAPPRGFGVLTTTGRRTGKPRRKCVRAIRTGERIYLVMLGPPLTGNPNAVAGWLWNIRADPSVTVRIRGGTFKGVARELEKREAEQARETYCETVHPFDYAMCLFHRGGRPTRAKIQQMTRHWFDTGAPLVIDLAAA